VAARYSNSLEKQNVPYCLLTSRLNYSADGTPFLCIELRKVVAAYGRPPDQLFEIRFRASLQDFRYSASPLLQVSLN
jgi:hypothetical protein